jgi:isoquinoline 1-oxidoreductase subunit beta
MDQSTEPQSHWAEKHAVIPPHVSRRVLLTTAAASGASLLVGGGFTAAAAASESDGPRLNAWLRIRGDGKVVIQVSQTEMGQGISTTLPVALADELGIGLRDIVCENAPFDPAYRHPEYKWMFTGNSESVSALYDLMRHMGAAAREMLVSVAAARWGVDAAELSIINGRIGHPRSGRSLGIGDFASAAARLAPPEKPGLKEPSRLVFIGRATPRFDIPSKTDSSALFGIDVVVPRSSALNFRVSPAGRAGGTHAYRAIFVQDVHRSRGEDHAGSFRAHPGTGDGPRRSRRFDSTPSGLGSIL